MQALALLAMGVAPPFQAHVAPVPASYRLTSFAPGCPVTRSDLRVVTVSHWGFDRRVTPAGSSSNQRATAPIVTALRSLFAARFPIRRMELVERYGSSDDRSMAADNTSAFNCRRVEGSTSWSAHAYGLAIDVNPLENPYIRRGTSSRRPGRAFLNRNRCAVGMIHAGDAVVRAFAAVGWPWGGRWHAAGRLPALLGDRRLGQPARAGARPAEVRAPVGGRTPSASGPATTPRASWRS